jgi:hypothetical protein
MADTLAYCPDDIPHCPAHSDGLVRKVTDGDFYIINGERCRAPFQVRSVHYECSECGHVLWASPPVQTVVALSQARA